MIRRTRSGQSSTETLMVSSVLVIALVFAAYAFVPGIQSGIEGLGEDVKQVYTSATGDGSGELR